MPIVIAALTTSTTISQLRDQLGLEGDIGPGHTASTVTDAQLQPYLNAAMAICAGRCGPVVQSGPITEVHDGGSPTIIVRQTPIASVASLIEYVGNSAYPLTEQPLGQSVDNYGFSIDDPTSGLIVRRGQSGTPIPFATVTRSVVVVYTAGFAAVPADLALGILILTQHLYASRVGSSSSRPGTTSAGAPSTYAVPHRVLELWQDYLKGPGLA